MQMKQFSFPKNYPYNHFDSIKNCRFFLASILCFSLANEKNYISILSFVRFSSDFVFFFFFTGLRSVTSEAKESHEEITKKEVTSTDHRHPE